MDWTSEREKREKNGTRTRRKKNWDLFDGGHREKQATHVFPNIRGTRFW